MPDPSTKSPASSVPPANGFRTASTSPPPKSSCQAGLVSVICPSRAFVPPTPKGA